MPATSSRAAGTFGPGHALFAASGVSAFSLVFCRRCGAHGEFVYRNLLSPCSGEPAAASLALNRLRRSQHPRIGRPLGPATPFIA